MCRPRLQASKRPQSVAVASGRVRWSSLTGPIGRTREGIPMVQVESLVELPQREVWPDKARDFTPRLAEHPGHLSRAPEMDLETAV